ncbi:hypothetical protein PAI11_00590 [Patulibacter medicamentivorans]|uniref:Uncharacterized protein n=1 Tax=Patulibacter medicamentivorans TaxID=1097667 RepID=H0DZV4_9ACTN|nr:hypothetical protein PAI11_00590 [Patulibacter medicamentivorans]
MEEFVAIFDRWQEGKRSRDAVVTVQAAGELRGWIWSTVRQDPTERDVQMDRVLTEAYARGFRMGSERSGSPC